MAAVAQGLAGWLAHTKYGRKVLAAQADFSAFRRRPPLSLYAGLVLIAASYLMGWAALILGGYLAVEGKQPLLLALGAAGVFLLVHLVFVAGVWLAGANYAAVLLHWATRKFLLKHIEDETDTA